MPLELTEFTWKSTANLPEIAHEQLSGVLHPPPHTHTTALYGSAVLRPENGLGLHQS
jgi:hypothetical protein